MKRLGELVAGRLRVSAELIRFLWRQKLWWMIPMVVFVLLAGILVVAGQQSIIAPVIYVLF